MIPPFNSPASEEVESSDDQGPPRGFQIRVLRGFADAILTMEELLRDLAEISGHPAFARAANALHQQPSGRPKINDAKLIEEARWLLQQGKAKSMNQALQRVARTVVDEDGVKSVSERLRRKMRADGKNHPRNDFSG